MGNQVLADRYEMACRMPSDIQDHLPTFVQTVKELGATKVIELGVRYGLSTLAFLYALEGRGRLWSVDCSFPVPANEQIVDGFHNVNLLDPQGPLGVIDWWVFLLGYDTWGSILACLPHEPIDLLFLDTNHVYTETLVELDLYYPKVRKGGRILLHDTAIEVTGNDPTGPPFPVRTAMIEFCEKHNLKWDNVDNCSGLGVIYV